MSHRGRKYLKSRPVTFARDTRANDNKQYMDFRRRAKKERRTTWIMSIILAVVVAVWISLIQNEHAFFQAAADGDTAAVKSLLQGVTGRYIHVNDTTGRGTYHNSALMYAAKYGHLQTVEFLVSRGADVTQKNGKGKTAAMLAAERGHTDIARFLNAQYATPVQNTRH